MYCVALHLVYLLSTSACYEKGFKITMIYLLSHSADQNSDYLLWSSKLILSLLLARIILFVLDMDELRPEDGAPQSDG